MEEKIEKYMPFVFFEEGERPEPEQQISYKIYQLPDGEKYHGIRFESKEQLEKDGVQLNREDYQLAYEGKIPDFKGISTLENFYTQFNSNRPEDFTGRSLSVSDVVVISNNGTETAYFCDKTGFTEMPEFFREKEIEQEKTAPTVSDLSVGDVILYEGKRREIEKISSDSVMMKDIDAPNFGGILLGTSDVLSYKGWQADMERNGFEILSKAEKSAPVTDIPEQAEPEDKGPVSLRKIGDFYEMYGKNAEIGAEILGLHMLSKNGEPMVGFPAELKDECSEKLRNAGYFVLIEEVFELNPPKREPEKLQTLQQVVDEFFGTDCEFAETADGTWKLSITDGEKVGELFYGGEPVCGIYNRGDKMEIEPYQEDTHIPEMLENAMLEHNPDKPVEIMNFQKNPLDKATKQTVDLMSDVADVEDIPAYDDIPEITLEYKGNAESIEEIRDVALSIGAIVTVSNSDGTISIQTYENHREELENLAQELDLANVNTP